MLEVILGNTCCAECWSIIINGRPAVATVVGDPNTTIVAPGKNHIGINLVDAERSDSAGIVINPNLLKL